jgi:hypothetical protein
MPLEGVSDPALPMPKPITSGAQLTRLRESDGGSGYLPAESDEKLDMLKVGAKGWQP